MSYMLSTLQWSVYIILHVEEKMRSISKKAKVTLMQKSA